jgi:hypothetical protein
MPIIENFASLFTLIANSEGSAANLNKDTIKRLISEYMVSSMIDINESVLDLDFNVELKIQNLAKGVKATLKDT